MNIQAIPKQFKLFLIVFLMITACGSELKAQIVVVVNPENPISNLSMDDLKAIYSGKITSYENGTKIVLTQTKGHSAEFYETVLRKSLNNVMKYWINLVFSGVSVTPPLECRSEEEAIRTVFNNIGAIGFIENSMIDERVKAITLNKIQAGKVGYPFEP